MKILMQFDVDPRQFIEEINKALLRPRSPDDTIDLLVDTRIDVDDAYRLRDEIRQRLSIPQKEPRRGVMVVWPL